MRKEIFEVHRKRMKKLENKMEQLERELASIQEKIEPFIQYHEPLITISTMKEKYWHCNSPIVIDGEMTRHSVYLGIKDKFEGKTDKKLIKLAQRKMGDLLRKKYPEMFE